MRRMNSKKSKNFHFQPKLSFSRENYMTNNWSEILDFDGFNLHVIFDNFHEISFFRNRNFEENREIYI